MVKLEIGLLYLGLHNQLTKKFGVNGIVSRKEFYIKIARHGQIPKNLRPLVIKEMEDRQLIKRVNRDAIQILPIDIDIEKDCTQIYRIAGLY